MYKEVVDRVRSSGTDVVLNLTTGMGGDLEIGSGKNPLDVGPNTDMAKHHGKNRKCRAMSTRNLFPRLWFFKFWR